MPVYALYVPTARRSVTGVGMEKFASRELAGRVLKERNATGRSRTFYVGVPRPERGSDWAEAVFAEADETGYMRVFLRYARDPVPHLLDTPDEEWIVREGGKQGVVERMPWGAGTEQLAATLDARLRVVPAPVAQARRIVPVYEMREPAGVKPAVATCESCYMLPSVTGRCGCS